jgi:RNA recognition motif-containing protein
MSKIYVGNISFSAKEADLRQLFESHGTVAEVSLPTDRDTGRMRGFAFVSMPDSGQAKAAIDALNGQDFMGRALVVNEARPQEPRSGGFGGGRGGGYGGKGGRDRGGFGGKGGRDRDRGRDAW